MFLLFLSGLLGVRGAGPPQPTPWLREEARRCGTGEAYWGNCQVGGGLSSEVEVVPLGQFPGQAGLQLQNVFCYH